MTMNELVLSVLDGPIARLTLNDPGHANVLSHAMIEALDAALAGAIVEPAARVIVLGASGRIFSAGHDLGEMRATEEMAEHRALFDRCGPLMMAIGASPKPVIAKAEGAAVAAGCEVPGQCDLG